MNADDIQPGGPVEPAADMIAFAKLCRGMFVALTLEGFSEQQALVIVGQTIAASFSSGDL